MSVDTNYKEILVNAIKNAPDECFDWPPSVKRMELLDSDERVENAASLFEAYVRECGLSFEEAKRAALDYAGLKYLNLFFI